MIIITDNHLHQHRCIVDATTEIYTLSYTLSLHDALPICTDIIVVIITDNHLHQHCRIVAATTDRGQTSTPNGFFFAESGLNPRYQLLLQLDLLQQTSSSSITTSPPELEYLLFFLLRNQRRKPTVKRRIFFAPPTDSDSHGL